MNPDELAQYQAERSTLPKIHYAIVRFEGQEDVLDFYAVQADARERVNTYNSHPGRLGHACLRSRPIVTTEFAQKWGA